MFKLQPKPTFKTTITFFDVDGTELDKADFEFRYKTDKEIDAMREAIGKPDGPQDDADFIARLLVSTTAIEGEITRESVEATFSPLASAPLQILTAYHNERRAVRRKN